MKYNSNIQEIDRAKLCLGCGLCESLLGVENVKMELLSDGFFHPIVKNNVLKEEIIKKVCPGINVVNDLIFDDENSIWGKIENIYSAFSTDEETRFKASSGGVISELAIFLLKSKFVNSILQVGGNSKDFNRNSLKISKNKHDVLSCASSRYAPALIFNEILEIFENSGDESFCFIGKPCDISALKNLLNEFPEYQKKIKLTIAIFCAGMPSMNATKTLIENFKPKSPIKNLKYRGNGWPGFFSFKDDENANFKMSYNDSWGNVLGKNLHYRCKICPDGIGIQADITVGDAWKTNDGYPDFSEKDGVSILLTRTTEGTNAVNSAIKNKSLVTENLSIDILKKMQPYQYNRRQKAGIRYLAAIIGKRKRIKFNNLKLFYNVKKIPLFILAKEFLGSLKRSI